MALKLNYPNCYFRRCSKEEIITLFDTERLQSKMYRFLSLTKSNYPPSANNADYIVVYDRNKLRSQGAIELEYTVEFMNENEEILKHISINYFDDSGYGIQSFGRLQEWVASYSPKSLREYGLPLSTSYEEWVDFRTEQICLERIAEEEVVIESINLVKGLVVDVLFSEVEMSMEEEPDIFQAITRYMERHNINFNNYHTNNI